MKRSDVLLLGGAGFIGTALANKLATEGRQACVLAPSAARGIDVRATVLDISRLGACPSWKPQTSLEEGVRRTWGWLKQA